MDITDHFLSVWHGIVLVRIEQEMVEVVRALRALGLSTVVECGPGKVLAGMVKRIDKDLATVALETPADLDAFGKSL